MKLPPLPESLIGVLLAPYLIDTPPPLLLKQISLYLDILLKWNAVTNLTSIRSPEDIVRRHFGESLFAARHLPTHLISLLDFGSGAGFPGLPIQLFLDELRVTLAESRNKKVAFLREVIRTLELPTQIWGSRVQAMPRTRRFDAVILRAVDNPPIALLAAADKAAHYLICLTGQEPIPLPPAFAPLADLPVPLSTSSRLLIAIRASVPRGT